MTHHLVGMAEIAEILGVSRQRVAQLVESYEDFPAPEVDLAGGRVWSRTAIETWITAHPERKSGRPEATETETEPARDRSFSRRGSGMFERFTDLARQAIVKGQEEARLLKHNYLGTEHLLLGLVALREGAAFSALNAIDVGLETVRAGTRNIVGEGSEAPTGHIPFTPRAKTVLECSLGEALKLDHNYVGTEHILLALVGEKDGVAWKILEAEGLQPAEVRHAVLWAVLRTLGAPQRQSRWKSLKRSSSSVEAATCSFCGKHRSKVEKLVAGPGVFICDECVRLCVEIIAEEKAEPASGGSESVDALTERVASLEAALTELMKRLSDD